MTQNYHISCLLKSEQIDWRIQVQNNLWLLILSVRVKSKEFFQKGSVGGVYIIVKQNSRQRREQTAVDREVLGIFCIIMREKKGGKREGREEKRGKEGREEKRREEVLFQRALYFFLPQTLNELVFAPIFFLSYGQLYHYIEIRIYFLVLVLQIYQLLSLNLKAQHNFQYMRERERVRGWRKGERQEGRI